jgi:MSHA biogenesis protein MshJ
MNALSTALDRLRPLIERLDALSLRERVFVFGAGVAIIYMGWQGLLMDRLGARARVAEQHLTDVRKQMDAIDEIDLASAQNPTVAAAARNRALKTQLEALDAELHSLAQGYVAPDRMTELLRQLLAAQQGLKLISLANLPVESLSRAPDPSGDKTILPGDRGPFLHPVEMVVDGDYASVVAYLRSLEALPWRIHWEHVDLVAGEYPTNRIRIVIGALSLSRDWIAV